MQPKVIIDTTGGTIESEQSEKGIAPKKRGFKTVVISEQRFPYHEICRYDSTDIDDRIRNKKIGPTIAKQARDGYNPVILHGTDTLADTTGVMDYNLYGNNRRIVFTGALYPPDVTQSDAEINKKDALTFAMRGYSRSGVFIVIGGNVLSSFLWGKHNWRPHDPVLELLRLSDEKGVFDEYEIELHEPFEPIAMIKGDDVVPGYPSGPTYDETTYLRVDDVFRISQGGEGRVRSLDSRGEEPPTGKVREFNHIMRDYARYKTLALNNPERKHEAIAGVERILRNLNVSPDIFTVYWKDLKVDFDPRTNLKEVLVVGDTYSNPLPYIGGIEDGEWSGIVVRGVGYGHIKLNNKWEKVLGVARACNVPVSIVTDEGLITSNEYAVAKPMYDEQGVDHSGTLNAKEAQIRMATCIGHKNKRRFITENVAELFDLEPLDIISAYYVPGTLFKNTEQREEWVRDHRYSTNLDYAVTPLLRWEEKILWAGLNKAYVSGKIGLKYFH